MRRSQPRYIVIHEPSAGSIHTVAVHVGGQVRLTQLWVFCFADQDLFAKHASCGTVDAETPLITAQMIRRTTMPYHLPREY